MRAPVVGWEFWELYDKGDWEPETKTVLGRFLSPGDFFVDVGAWVGPVTLWACSLGATVLALEPDAEAFAGLTETTEGLPVTRLEVALAAWDGVGHLSNPWEFGDSRSRLSTEGRPVATISPATLLAGITPALVKLDIEGGELDVLPSLAPLCAERGIPLYVSWHEDWWDDPPALSVRQSWFSGFKTCEGDWGAFNTLLAIP